MRRHIGYIAFFAALSFTAAPAAAFSNSYDAKDSFAEGVELLRLGDDVGALEKFSEALAEDMSNEAAYELWKSTDHDIWIDMLVKEGQFELIAKRFMTKADLGRVDQADDESAIRALLKDAGSGDAMVRTKAVRSLAANHGEYAVQYMLDTLGDDNAEDRRVLFMHALTEMGTDVVLPLIAALGSDNSFLRRNVALVLGYIGDPRAQAALTWYGKNDTDEGVMMAASDSAKKLGSGGDAHELFLQLGDDYHFGRASVLRSVDYSDVVWSWADDAMHSRAVPRFLYADEMSKGAYYEALKANPASLDALAGIARAYVSEQAEINLRAQAGADVSGLSDQVAESSIAVNSAGADALERALSWCVKDNDSATGVGLIRLLGNSSLTATPSLQAALGSNDGAMKGEAAVALGQIALRNHSAASASVVSGLGLAAGREIMSIGVVIDSNEARGAAIAAAMTADGMLVNHWTSGASGLALLKRVPGVDVIVLADKLVDLTADQVLYEIEADDRTSETPVLMITESDAWSDRVAGSIVGAGDLETITGAIEEQAGSDRARADELAGRAASTLAGLAVAGNGSLEGAVDSLASTLDSRSESVSIPAMSALAAVGNVGQLGSLKAVLDDGDRSDEARAAAADAMAGIASRMNLSGTEGLIATLTSVIRSDAALSVRVAASRALSSLSITASQRADIAAGTRVDIQGN
ncbi:MAG: CheY-like chemotaxis protein [Planctomycetota bacterium]|jgi:CheY-like chemotaxis protein